MVTTDSLRFREENPPIGSKMAGCKRRVFTEAREGREPERERAARRALREVPDKLEIINERIIYHAQ
jgi:hypothetical protein